MSSFVIESTSSTEANPVYLTERRSAFGATFAWTADLFSAKKFDTQIDAQSFVGKVAGGRVKEVL